MYQAGLDPAKDRTGADTAALVSSINKWVRKLANEEDFPEWTTIEARTPDVNHVVPLNATGFSGAPGLSQMDRLLRVYLLDPRITDGPLDIPFRRLSNGVWVGFEHGAQVWMKFMLPVPQFTSTPWNVQNTYSVGDLVYSKRAGEVFKSRVNGNIGHDPSLAFTHQPLPPVVTQTAENNNPGLAAQTKIIDLYFTTNSDVIPPDVPPDLSQFYCPILNPDSSLLTSATVLADGVTNLSDIITNMRNTLAADPFLSTFIITADPANKKIRFENASDFYLIRPLGSSAPFYVPNGGPIYYLTTIQVQSFLPVVSGAAGAPQITQVTLATDDVVIGATYTLEVTDESNEIHSVDYTSENESDLGILAGLTMAIDNSSDTFFQGVGRSILAGSPNVLSLTTQTPVGVRVTLNQDANPYWEKVPFPYALADQVVRGVYADWLKSEGQHTKGMAEEQLVPTEQQNRVGQELLPKPNVLTDQVTIEQ